MHQIQIRLGLRPRPCWELTALPRLPSCEKWMGGERRGEGKEMVRKGGKVGIGVKEGERRGRKGKEDNGGEGTKWRVKKESKRE